MYWFEFKGKKYCIDATAESPFYGRLLNHSCKTPNCATKPLDVSFSLSDFKLTDLCSDARPDRPSATYHLRERRHSCGNRASLRLRRSVEEIAGSAPLAQTLKFQPHKKSCSRKCPVSHNFYWFQFISLLDEFEKTRAPSHFMPLLPFFYFES